jgi:hypothetical protein
MSSSDKTAKMSIADKAARVVSTWSPSKKAAFEQRTGLTLTKVSGSDNKDSGNSSSGSNRRAK